MMDSMNWFQLETRVRLGYEHPGKASFAAIVDMAISQEHDLHDSLCF